MQEQLELEWLQVERLKLHTEENETMRAHDLVMREREREEREREREEKERERKHELEVID